MSALVLKMNDGRTVEIGDTVKDFRGNPVVVAGIRAPRTSASTGRVTLNAPNGVFLGEFYPSVIGAAIVQLDHSTESQLAAAEVACGVE